MQHTHRRPWPLYGVAFVLALAATFVAAFATGSWAGAISQEPDPCFEDIQRTEHESAKFTQTTKTGRISGQVYDVSEWTMWAPKTHVEWHTEPYTSDPQHHASWNEGAFHYERMWRLQPTGETRINVVVGPQVPCEDQPPADTRTDEDVTVDCDNGVVTTTTRNYETPFVLVDFEWVPGDEVLVSETSSQRPATDEECPPPPECTDANGFGYSYDDPTDGDCGDTPPPTTPPTPEPPAEEPPAPVEPEVVLATPVAEERTLPVTGRMMDLTIGIAAVLLTLGIVAVLGSTRVSDDLESEGVES